MSQDVEMTIVRCVPLRLEDTAAGMNTAVDETEVWIDMLGDGGVAHGRRMGGALGTGAVALEDGTLTKMPISLFSEEIQGMYQMFR